MVNVDGPGYEPSPVPAAALSVGGPCHARPEEAGKRRDVLPALGQPAPGSGLESTEALLDLAPAERCPHLRDALLVVPGERVAAAACEHGWRGRVVVASSAEDAAMADALGRALADGSRPGAA